MTNAHRRAEEEIKKLAHDRWKTRVFGNIAVVHCTLEIRAVVQGHEWGGEVLITDVWLKNGDSWQVLTRHTSPFVRSGAEESAS